MSKLDVAKEKIAYLKVWLSVLLAVLFSVAGWCVTTLGNVPLFYTIASIVLIVVVTIVITQLHKKIDRSINRLEKL